MEKDQKYPKKMKKKDTEKLKQISGKTTLANLPLDILFDILSRLPAKTLFGYRLVCKSWLSYVCDPGLAKIHLARASQNENPSFIFSSSDNNNYILDNVELSNLAIKLQLPFKKSKKFFTVAGSCNGLVCKMEDHSFYPFIHIFNPVTGEYAKLSLPSSNLQTYYSLAAFCCHPLTNEYKILLKVVNYKIEFFIYTLGSELWRKIKNTELLCRVFQSDATNVNGAIHWLSDHSYKGTQSFSIVSFDVGEEESRVFEHPSELTLDSSCELGVLGGCLSLSYCLDFDQNCGEIWVMKEYGLKESWTKLFVIEDNGLVMADMRFTRPLCILNSGKILLEHNDREFILYDPGSKMIRDVRSCRFPKSPDIRGISGLLIHVGSLVSLRTISDQEWRGNNKRKYEVGHNGKKHKLVFNF